jgi:hypothetical protein
MAQLRFAAYSRMARMCNGRVCWSCMDIRGYGYYEGTDLIYAARTRNGFTPKLRAELMKKFKTLEIPDCPFSNLPETRAVRWGAGLTAAKMVDCRWLNPVLVAQFEFAYNEDLFRDVLKALRQSMVNLLGL